MCILGRQPALGVAELEALCEDANLLRKVSPHAVIIKAEPSSINFSRLGGTVKFCKLLAELPLKRWPDIEAYLAEALPAHLHTLPASKLRLGVSTYGIDVSPAQINATTLRLKKRIREQGKSVRIIANTNPALSSAQVLHNKLTGAGAWELVLVGGGKHIFLAQNIAEQDIEAYAQRDQKRPMRDSRVGMLPPKLAQIIINLAAAATSLGTERIVLDPFCGSGVILQEATLMGFNVHGSDINAKMIEYADQNLMWLLTQPNCPVQRPPDPIDPSWRYFQIEQADATRAKWEPLPDFIASETYLGQPFASPPTLEALHKTMRETDSIHRQFLLNLASQTKPGFRLCVAVPAWHLNGKVHHLKTLDSLPKLGYTRLSFVHAPNRELIYRRPHQIVGRELVVLVRK